MVSDERALAVRLASTERRRPRPDVRGPRCRRFRRPGTTSSTPLPGCWIRRPSSARSHGSPARRSSPCSPPSTALPCRSELAVLRPLALVGDDGAPFGAVAARVRTASIARPDAFVTEPPAPPVVAANDSDAAAAAERAFTTVGALADVLLAGLHTPLSRTGTGAVSAIDRRRLTDAGALGSADDIDDLVAAAAAADLVTPLGSRVDRDRRGHAVARSDHHPTLGGHRGGAAQRRAGGSAHRRRRLPAARRAGRAPTRCMPSGPNAPPGCAASPKPGA